ncbi:P18 [Chrysodeixis includens nucleopolyhedrovirus]|uniref:P18 n=1 Tax=Chrysodeixis includens nucleopolyhedrovirus TaxID=1207438 RepID=A0A5B8YSC8_9ABAC|nr:P18 [Chrysodeixis includens nucleopolyhedrovirus]QED40603.1 P18 [Chrysodeixis includens nucleopolyhedrovirus]
MDKAIYLYLCDMPEGVHNDKADDENVIYFEGIIECFNDEDNDKFCFFSELKKEEALFMKKTFQDLIEHSNGTYCKNHVLIDALIMYKTYAELVDESAFGVNILNYCVDFLTNIFKLFRLQSRIVVIIPTNVDWQQDNLSVLLKHLEDLTIIEIASK